MAQKGGVEQAYGVTAANVYVDFREIEVNIRKSGVVATLGVSPESVSCVGMLVLLR